LERDSILPWQRIMVDFRNEDNNVKETIVNISIFVKFMFVGLLLFVTGCATLEVTQKKAFDPGGEKQPVTLGIQASGDRLIEVLDSADGSIVKAASGQLFDKVILLPKETKFKQAKEIQSAYAVDYILSVAIGDISVSGDLNPLWFASVPLLFFKVYAPIVTFQPGVSLDVSLRDAATGDVLIQKQVMETSSDHYAPNNPSPQVRKLISLTINNALVSILRDTQKGVAAARQGNK
jgi:hypothetical protein